MLSALATASQVARMLLRECQAVRASHGLAISETVSMKKPPTGEPYAGKPPVRFGGRGRCKPIPTPIIRRSKAMWQGPAMTETLVVMGPRLRGDDSGWVRAKDT